MFNVSKSDLAFTFALSRSGAMCVILSSMACALSVSQNAEELNRKHHLVACGRAGGRGLLMS